ncbi:MAG: glycoside hydrolase family 15 protein [Candidatus Diapherotrites archaeon]|nr:glycoside hydrolase family 15 protein [Candidatus Diapherotrites archaeon]
MDNTTSDKIKELLKTSKQVIQDCSLPNGAIIAANSTKPYAPKEAKYYKFVWPRDAMYTCMAADILGINIAEKFFKWCMKAEGWQKTGLFYEKYFINGKKALHHFQPDQTGSVLMAVFEHCKNNKNDYKKFQKLIEKSANGLCNVWKKDHFTPVTQDLWEERLCFPDLKENFTYSLAICSRGLSCANKLIPNKKWQKTSNEMKTVLLKNFKNEFYRSFGKMNDTRIDASLLGLVWPSGTVDADDTRIKKTIKLIEEKLSDNLGIHRYEHDEYDGWMYNKTTHRKKGGGYWPLLNFWLTICYLEQGNNEKALKYHNKVLEDIKNKKFIPEQIFNNDIQKSVCPLCWSHSMFVIASKKLKHI